MVRRLGGSRAFLAGLAVWCAGSLPSCGDQDGRPPKPARPGAVRRTDPPSPPPPPPVAPKAPEGPIERVGASDAFEFGPGTAPDGRGALRMTLRLDNPNPTPIRVEAIAYSLRSAGRIVAAATHSEPVDLPAEGHAVVHIAYSEPGWLVLLEEIRTEGPPILEGYLRAADPLPPDIARRAEFYFEAGGLSR